MPTNATTAPMLTHPGHAEERCAEAPTLPFERRMAERFETIGKVEAVRMGPAEALYEPKLDLRLIDESITGAGFGTEEPLSPGTQIEVRIGHPSAPWKSGRVVRCIATSKGYRVGVEYGRRLAA